MEKLIFCDSAYQYRCVLCRLQLTSAAKWRIVIVRITLEMTFVTKTVKNKLRIAMANILCIISRSMKWVLRDVYLITRSKLQLIQHANLGGASIELILVQSQ